tara:strand:+ start:19147 stop:19635 length:489 start_codon:yes stop_codon:yes gene_type:complete
MPRNPKGEMNLGDIRSLVRQHNKLNTITGVDTKSRAALLKDLTEHGYKVDHENKKIVKSADRVEQVSIKKDGTVKATGRSYTRKGAKGQEISVGKAGERKPQAKTVAKAKRKAFAKQEKPNVNTKTGKPKMKPPPVGPAIAKQKAAKAQKSAKRGALAYGGD